jgi:hypothetical protein
MKKGWASKFGGRTTSVLIATCPRASTQKFYLSTPDLNIERVDISLERPI